MSKPGSAISIYDVVSSLEGKISFVSSHEVKENDTIETAVSGFWKKAEDNLIEYLQHTTIDDLLQKASAGEQMYYI